MDDDEGFYQSWMNQESSKKKRKFNKDDAIYGVFKGYDSSDDEEEKSKLRTRLMQPMSFVQKGRLTEDGVVDEKDKEEEEDEGNEANVEDEGASKGKWKGRNRRGIDDDEDEEEDFVPSDGLGFTKSNEPFRSTKIKKAKGNANFGLKAFALSSHSSRSHGPSDADLSKYGIGSKLLMKMGWKSGEGLGKNSQGISRPIEVKQRPNKAGLGIIQERTQQQREDFPSEGDLEERAAAGLEVVDEGPQEKGWKRGKARREKRVYRLPTDLGPQPAQKLVIKDMRGEEVRILSNVNEIFADGPISEYMQELQHNVRLLATQKEGDIINISRKQTAEKDFIEKLSQSQRNLQAIVQSEAEKIARLKEVTEIVAKCKEKLQAKEISTQTLAKTFKMFQTKFREEYMNFKLYLLASALVLPLLKEKLDAWKPLQQPEVALNELAVWKELTYSAPEESEFEEVIPVTNEESGDVYTQLVLDLVLPKFRTCLLNEWNVRNPEPCLVLLENWKPLLPPVLLENIFEQLIIPRLAREVGDWNPRQDTIPIHSWLHPWLPLLGGRLDPLYPPIRQKLGQVLKDWNPIDISAHIILAPWKKVFDEHSMEQLLERSITPKLTMMMKNFVINPRAQDLTPFKAFTIWEDLIPHHIMANLLLTEFFPKWHQVLFTWLSSQADFTEVSQWYMGWKQQFSQDMLSNDKIRQQFNYALNVMNSVVSGQPPPPPPSIIATPSVAAHPPPPKPFVPPVPMQPIRSMDVDQLSFKDVVEKFAEDHGLYLLPTPRRHEGKTVYNFGKIPIIITPDLVYKQEKGQWIPTSIDQLLKQ